MAWETIRKSGPYRVSPNLPDYATARASFTWEAARAELAGLPGGGLNIAFEAVDRHAASGRVALRCLRKGGTVEDIGYADLAARTNRFANLLVSLGVKKGERVFGLAGRVPELYVAALGSLKAGAVFCPLFSAFGPEPILTRLQLGEAKVLVTTEALYERKVAAIRNQVPSLERVIVIGADWDASLAAMSDTFAIPPTAPEDPALLHFTSGTTGKPKGALHVHEAVVAHRLTGKLALDLRPGDIFWCTADPGWVTGTSYGIVAPLANGVTLIVDEEDFDPQRWCRVLQDQRVTVWYTAPTAIRMMMRQGVEPFRRFDYSSLRLLASVGEPLNPEGVVWGQQVFGSPFHDTWWQTETGAIMIANYPTLDVRPGSMGKPLPGIEAAILRPGPGGGLEPAAETDAEGELALKVGWPSQFRGYLDEPERTAKRFVGGWYLTGDIAKRDADGYYWFVGRADDVIKSSGHLVSPFEVESLLLEHPAVAEAGVIGKPDPVTGESIKAFVSLKAGQVASDALVRELVGFARKRLGAALAPREIAILDGLPRTRSGKIMRRLLKARELGLPEGDISTLDD
ncbi:MAG: acetate--CoA ligase [Magnetospirillum sp. WYHS-4]